jgi:hypothetical protein
MAQRSFQGLAERHDFLVHRAMAWWFAKFLKGFLVPVKPVFLDLSSGNL